MDSVCDKASYAQRRFLVAGCGSIGMRHIKNLLALGVKDVIAFDVDAARRQKAALTLGITSVDDLQAAWEQGPEGCLITAPTSLHVSLALAAAQHDCHLFTEKPLSHSCAGVKDLQSWVARKNLITLVGCNMRFHPGLRVVKALLADRSIGRVVAARVEVGQYLPDWHPEEDYRLNYSARRELGGGIILDAIHEIDYIRWLIGEVTHAVCMAGKLSGLEINSEDTAALLLRFDCGAVGEIHLDYIQRAHRRSCQIIGEEGTIHWDYQAGEVRWYSAHTRAWRCFANPAGWQSNQMYVDEISHFLACLAGEEQAELDVGEGAKVLRIALAAKQSAARKSWIELEHGSGAEA